MTSSAYLRAFLSLTVRVRTLNVPTVISPTRVFNLAAVRTAQIIRRLSLSLCSFHPSNMIPVLVFGMLPMHRMHHSRPATFASTLCWRLHTHVGSPVISTLHTTELTLLVTEPHRCCRPERPQGIDSTIGVNSPSAGSRQRTASKAEHSRSLRPANIRYRC